MELEHSASAGLVQIQNLIDDAKCFEAVRKMRWPEGVSCPHCRGKHVIKFGRDETREHRQRYRCKSCGRCFDDLAGTILEGHHLPLRTWSLCDYDTYVAHMRATHPDLPVTSETEFFRNRQEARHGS